MLEEFTTEDSCDDRRFQWDQMLRTGEWKAKVHEKGRPRNWIFGGDKIARSL